MAVKTHKQIRNEIQFLITKDIFDEFIVINDTFIVDNFSFISENNLTPVSKGLDVYLVKEEDSWKYKKGRDEAKIIQEKTFLERLHDKKVKELDEEQMKFIDMNSVEPKEEVPVFDYESLFSKNEKYSNKATKLKLIK